MYEQEVKLTAGDGAVLTQVLESELVRRLDTGVGGEDATHYLGVYYDTDAGDMQRGGCSLRARREGEHWRATLKFDGAMENGLSQRRELMADIDGWLDHAGQLPDGELKDKVLALIPPQTPLHQRVSVDMRRSIRNLEYDGAAIELAADSARIENRKGRHRQAMLYEIELELKHGDIAKVVELGELLAQQFPLTPSTTTKHGIGLQLGLE